MAFTVKEAERIKGLEVGVETLIQSNKELSEKVETLLILKHKGVGAFWLASALLGTGIIGFINIVIDWFKGG